MAAPDAWRARDVALGACCIVAALLVAVTVALAQGPAPAPDAPRARSTRPTPTDSQVALFASRAAVSADAQREATIAQATRVAPIDLEYGVP